MCLYDTIVFRVQAFFVLAVEEYIESIGTFLERDRTELVFHHLLTEVPCWEKLSLLEHLSVSWTNFHLLQQKKDLRLGVPGLFPSGFSYQPMSVSFSVSQCG